MTKDKEYEFHYPRKAWAEREVELACARERKATEASEKEWDYGCSCLESALKAYKSLLEDMHSELSMSITQIIINRLINNKPLSPIFEEDGLWTEIGDFDDSYRGKGKSYQCKRYGSLVKDILEDGTVKYRDREAIRFINLLTNDIYESKFMHEILLDVIPLEMPYMPPDEPAKIYCEEFNTEEKEKHYYGMLYVILPDGRKIDIYRFFKVTREENYIRKVDELTQEEFEIAKLDMVSTPLCVAIAAI